MALVIGVSAHRNIRSQAVPQVRNAVKTALGQILGAKRAGEVVILNGLAEGGDMLCASVARELGIKTEIVLPTTENEYLSSDFSGDGIALFKELSTAENVVRTVVAPDTEGRTDFNSAQEKKDYAFRQQSIFVAAQSDILLALWDGNDSDMSVNECGTAFAVRTALEHNIRGAKNIGAVIAVFAPRDGKAYARRPNEIRYLLRGTTCGYYDEHAEMPELFKTIITAKKL